MAHGETMTDEAEQLLDGMDAEDVVETPKDEKLEADVQEVAVLSKAEAYNLEDGEEPKHGERDDRVIQVTAICEKDGREYRCTDSFQYYERPTSRSDLGKYITKYGQPPHDGQEVTVDWDGEGLPSIALE